jgi:superfamily II DNA or RNA helicase
MRVPKLKTPLETGAYSLYKYSSDIENKLSYTSYFGDSFSLCERMVDAEGNSLLGVARAITPAGADKTVLGEKIPFDINFTPRNKEQHRVVRESVTRIRNGESFIVQAPTGFGKTIVASAMIGHYGRKTLIIVPKNDIIGQWVKALKSVLNLSESEIGLIQGDTCQVKGRKVCIAMVHSICKVGRYPDWIYREFGMVMVDETHIMGADTFSNAMWMFPARIRLGLSATPKRKDGKDLIFYAHIGGVKVKSEAMPMKFKVIRKRSSWKCPKYKVRDGMAASGYSYIRMPHKPGRTQNINKALAKDPERNNIIVEFVLAAYNKKRSTIIFSDLKEYHLDRLYSALRRAGIPAKDIAYYVGGMSAAERDIAVTKPILLATYAMCSMATDIPWLDTCVLATPRSDVIQVVGRILREFPDKKEPVVFDVVDEDSSVLKGYATKRLSWYHSLGSRVLNAA